MISWLWVIKYQMLCYIFITNEPTGIGQRAENKFGRPGVHAITELSEKQALHKRLFMKSCHFIKRDTYFYTALF
jgi:hypothetical protein